MKGSCFFLVVMTAFILLSSCTKESECDVFSSEKSIEIRFKSISGGNSSTFEEAGYDSIKYLEGDSILHLKESFKLSLPLNLSENVTSFIFVGEQVSDTFSFVDYHPYLVYINQDCGYEFTIDTPSLAYHTFPSVVYNENQLLLTINY
jgi:hypothetical protein